MKGQESWRSGCYREPQVDAEDFRQPTPKHPMKKITPTNILLGIIAAEVVALTVAAMAARQSGKVPYFPSMDHPEPQEAPERLSFGEALQRAAGLLRRFFFPSGINEAPDYGRGGNDRKAGNRFYDADRRKAPVQSGEEDQREIGREDQPPHIAAKLKDPAWAGLLAANDGNISLTEAERAVPMPNSAQFVGRLDKNPFVGKGMKDHSRDKQ